MEPVGMLALLGTFYTLPLLYRAKQKHGSYSKIPDGEIAVITGRFGVFIGLALAAQSLHICFSASTEFDWLIGGLVGILGGVVLLKSLRHVRYP
ncbi:MAG: hypothetical protein AB1516_15240 [Pseudomonadota bacterium]